MFMERVRWGIIGTGNIAHDFARDLAFLDPHQEVQAILGHSKKNTEEFARAFNVPQQFINLEEFTEKAQIDVVYIASPHTLHHEQAMACLQNKIPVLCEKPMAINLDQCNELIETSRDNNTFLMEGLWIRFLPSIQKLLQIIEKGQIGRIISIKASVNYKAPYDPHSRYFDPHLGGGSLLDLGVYPVFLALLLLGKPTSIKSIGKLSYEGVDESCAALLEYWNGQSAVLESSLLVQTETPAEIIGEKGTIRILHPWFERSPGIEVPLYNKQRVIYPTLWDGHGLHYEAQEVLNCIRNGRTESGMMPQEFSRNIFSVTDEIRKQINVSYKMYE